MDGESVASVSGYVRVPRRERFVTVDPGVDITPGTVIVATPFENLRGRSFWVTRNIVTDTFNIRLSDTRGSATPFSWLIVENEVLAAEIEAAAAEAAAVAEEEEAAEEAAASE